MTRFHKRARPCNYNGPFIEKKVLGYYMDGHMQLQLTSGWSCALTFWNTENTWSKFTTARNVRYGNLSNNKHAQCSSEGILISLDVPVVQRHKFPRCCGRLPIGRPYRFYQGHHGQETGLLSTRFRLRKWRTRILHQWLLLVILVNKPTVNQIGLPRN